jgi:hypothetical protein
MSVLRLFLTHNRADRTSVVAVQKPLEARGIIASVDRDELVAGLHVIDAPIGTLH